LNQTHNFEFIHRTYLPDKVSYILSLWKTELGKINEKAGQSLADPVQYENLFPGFQEALKTQQFLEQNNKNLLPASFFTQIPLNIERNAMEEMHSNEQQGNFEYSKTDKPENGHVAANEITESIQRINISETANTEENGKARKNSLDEFDFDIGDEELDENIDTSEVNIEDDDELLSD
jgi:coatomer subunit beta'